MRAIHGAMSANREAFADWLTTGSRSDWSARIGQLRLPALVLCGDSEEALGQRAQAALTLPHYGDPSELVELVRTGHLAPIENSGEVAERFAAFLSVYSRSIPPLSPPLGKETQALLDSPRTSVATRRALVGRLEQAPRHFLDVDERTTLRALVATVIPDAGFDLAASLETLLASKKGDGFRPAALAADIDACRVGLAKLRTQDFVNADDSRRRALVTDALRHHDAQALWLADTKATIVRLYMADPRTLDRIHFTGFAVGDGFTQIRLGEREGIER